MKEINILDRIDFKFFVSRLDGLELSLAHAIMAGESVMKWANTNKIKRMKAYEVFASLKQKGEAYYYGI